MQLTTYNKYKNSGLEWLGKIPKHWEIRRTKDVFKIERGKFTHRPRNDERLYNDGSYPFIQTGDISKSNTFVKTHKQKLNNEGIKYSKLFKKGTMVMTIAATIGEVAILDFDCYFPDSIVAFHTKYNPKYYFYLFLVSKSELDTVKTSNAQDNLNLERLNSLFKVVPPIHEQTLIANYLDQQTTLIDKKIDLLNQKIKHYKELKTALINRVVTKGLNDTVEMKDSGVEWIGEIPKNWELLRFKDITRLIIDGTHYTPTYTDSGVHFLSVNDITRNPFDISKSKFISIEAHSKLIERCKPEKDDILLSKNGTIGVPFIIDFENEVSIYVSLCLMKLKSEKVDSKFFYYHLLSQFMFEQYKINSKTTSVSNLHLDKLKKFYCIIPTIEEQRKVVQYLDEKTAILDKIIFTLQSQTKHQKELRKALINDVVTGKVKVSH